MVANVPVLDNTVPVLVDNTAILIDYAVILINNAPILISILLKRNEPVFSCLLDKVTIHKGF